MRGRREVRRAPRRRVSRIMAVCFWGGWSVWGGERGRRAGKTNEVRELLESF